MGNQPDSSIFTFNPTTSSVEFETFSDDIQQAGTYQLRLTASYEGNPNHYTNTATLDFEVELVNPCIDADLTIDPSILSTLTIEYEVFDTAHEETFDSS